MIQQNRKLEMWFHMCVKTFQSTNFIILPSEGGNQREFGAQN